MEDVFYKREKKYILKIQKSFFQKETENLLIRYVQSGNKVFLFGLALWIEKLFL